MKNYVTPEMNLLTMENCDIVTASVLNSDKEGFGSTVSWSQLIVG